MSSITISCLSELCKTLTEWFCGLSESCRSWSHVIVEKEVLRHLFQDIRMFRKSVGEVGSWYGNWSQRKALWELWKKLKSYTILMSCDWYLSTVVLYSGHTDLKITYSGLFGTYTVLHTALYTHACFRNTHFECYMACYDMTIRLVL